MATLYQTIREVSEVMKKQRTQMIKQVCENLVRMVAEHVALTIGTVMIIASIVVLYYACQQGLFDDTEDPVVEIPFEG